MGLFGRLFGKKKELPASYEQFWAWFVENANGFYPTVSNPERVEKDFFAKLAKQLGSLGEGINFLTGMADSSTAELVFTADGIYKRMPYVEALVAAAPQIPNWKFTAHKPGLDSESFVLQMDGRDYGPGTMYFCVLEEVAYPDLVKIQIIHNDFRPELLNEIGHWSLIYLDNLLGELPFVSTVDHFEFVLKADAVGELIPIEKLKSYLKWRQKEFVEKYEGIWHESENDQYSAMEVTLESGQGIVAIINTTLLDWDRKASHPWILNIELKYDGRARNGMPNGKILEVMNQFEDEVTANLKDSEGYLNLARQTGANVREIFFACKDFRQPVIVLDRLLKQKLDGIEISYEIYKDKYWQSMDAYR